VSARRRAWSRGAALWAVAAAACAPASSKRSGGVGDLSQFECNDRRAEYMVVGGFVAEEAGVRMDCASGAPQISRWRLEPSGERKTERFALRAE
jgi:hypothetical protein